MRFVAMFVVAVALMAFAPFVSAKSTQLAKTDAKAGYTGTVVRVEGTTLTISAVNHKGVAKEHAITTDDKTQVTLDGKEAKLADLKEGMNVTVSPKKGTALTIAATTPVKTPAAAKTN